MGTATCKAVNADPELRLVATVGRGWMEVASADAELDIDDTAHRDRWLGVGLERLEALDHFDLDAVVDFSTARVALENARWCARHGKHLIVGVSGVDRFALDELSSLFAAPEAKANCMVVPNFALGAVILDRLAEIAAPYAGSIEIIEFHHGEKRDAPSGTSLATADRILGARLAAGSPPLMADPTAESVLDGARGAEAPGGIRIHSVRSQGMVAHQEVLLGMAAQTLSIRHDSYNRESFMPGVLAALKAVSSRPGLTVGLGAVLGL